MRAQHPARERENDAAREDATAEVSDQITTDSTQERERETSTSTTDRWILTGVASSIGGLCRHTVATSTVCVTKGTRGPASDERGPGDRRLTKGPGDQGTGVASSIGGYCRHTVATSTVCVTKGPGDRRLTKGTAGSRY